MPRQATLIIADEIYYNLHGKAILQGIYNSDLAIPSDPSKAPQLIFYFIIETDIAEPFQSLAVEVSLPGETPIRNFVFVPPPQFISAQAQATPSRIRFSVRHPMLITAPTLRVGRIDSKVIHEAGEILLTPQWIGPLLNPVASPN